MKASRKTIILFMLGCIGCGAVMVMPWRTATAQGLTERKILALEEKRSELLNERGWMVAEFMAHALRNPAAAAHALSSMGTLAGAFTDSLTENQRLVLGGLGAFLAIGCAMDGECRSAAARFLSWGQRVATLAGEIEAIDRQVGNRMLVRNSCAYPIRIAISHTNLAGRQQNTAWWHIDANEDAILKIEGKYLRTKNEEIFYYAETNTGSADPAAWAGNHTRSYGDRSYEARRKVLSAKDDDPYKLTLTCKGHVEDDGGVQTAGIAVGRFVLPPLVPGEWQVVTGSAAKNVSRVLRETLQDEELTAGDFLQKRRLKLPFYPNGHLVEVDTLLKNGQRGVYTFIVHSKGATLLNGEYPRIRAINKMLPIRLDSTADARLYLQLFNGALMGELGPFNLVEDGADIIWQKSATLEIQKKAASHIQPITVRTHEDGWIATATVKYGTALFEATFRIERNGLVEMTGDRPLVAELPIATEYFRDGIRFAER